MEGSTDRFVWVIEKQKIAIPIFTVAIVEVYFSDIAYTNSETRKMKSIVQT